MICHRSPKDWGPNLISRLAPYTQQAYLHHGDTMDINGVAPAGSKIVGLLVLTFESFELFGEIFDLRLCLGITQEELDFKLKHGYERLREALKAQSTRNLSLCFFYYTQISLVPFSHRRKLLVMRVRCKQIKSSRPRCQSQTHKAYIVHACMHAAQHFLSFLHPSMHGLVSFFLKKKILVKLLVVPKECASFSLHRLPGRPPAPLNLADRLFSGSSHRQTALCIAFHQKWNI
jgi:hypothetical protein